MYTYKEIPEGEQETKYYAVEDEDSTWPINQYEILDFEGDQIAVVLSETEAEGLVSHLNK